MNPLKNIYKSYSNLKYGFWWKLHIILCEIWIQVTAIFWHYVKWHEFFAFFYAVLNQTLADVCNNWLVYWFITLVIGRFILQKHTFGNAFWHVLIRIDQPTCFFLFPKICQCLNFFSQHLIIIRDFYNIVMFWFHKINTLIYISKRTFIKRVANKISIFQYFSLQISSFDYFQLDIFCRWIILWC